MPPPGYTPYQTGPTPTGRLGRIGGLATATMILTALAGLATAAASFLSIPATDKAKDFLAGRITEDEFNDSYTSVQVLQVISSPLALAAGVLTIIWMYKIANNVRTFGRKTTWLPVFSIVGWVLPPIINLIPFLVLRELWKASNPAPAHGDDGWKSSNDNPLLYLWFLVYGLVPLVILVLTFGPTVDGVLNGSGDATITAESLRDTSSYTLVTAVTTVIATVAWIVFVKQLTSRHIALTGER